MLSGIHGMLGELNEAGVRRRVIAIQPNHGQAHLNLGNVLYLQGDLDGAAQEYQNVLRINPNDAGVHNNLGNLLYNRGNIAEATRHLQESLRLNPNNAEAHSNLGNIFSITRAIPTRR